MNYFGFFFVCKYFCFIMQRFVCWADVTNLTAGVEYAAQPRIFDRRHKSHYLPISIENATDKVLQFELPDENKPFAFVAGGDYQVKHFCFSKLNKI